ncbi:MAG: adenine deaminase, partial [Clostridia bacterium]|nr:adenine deaminase [Clostridia bacterium]
SKKLDKNAFYIAPKSNKCRLIKVLPGTLITDELIADVDFFENNGVSTEKDILKIAVIERHKNTGHIGLGFINGIGLKKGAIASSVSHDSHNLIVVGASDDDMTIAANRIRELGGGYIVVVDGKILAELPLPIGGIMTDASVEETAKRNKELRDIVCELGVSRELNPFMNMAFSALSVIPHLKMTTLGLVDVDKQKLVSLFTED